MAISNETWISDPCESLARDVSVSLDAGGAGGIGRWNR